MRKRILLLLACLVGTVLVHGQELVTVRLDSTTTGTSIVVSSMGTRLLDDGGVGGPYDAREASDRFITITGECGDPYGFQFTIEDVGLRRKRDGQACADTLFIYDGCDSSGTLLWYATGNTFYPATTTVFALPTNTSQALTVRLKVCGDCGTWDTTSGRGFNIMAGCKPICESVMPRLDSIYYKTRNGEVYEFGRIKHLFDTVHRYEWDAQLNDSVAYIDTVPFEGVNLCNGDGVIFTAHCDYTSYTGWYTPSDTSSMFLWDMGTTKDTIMGRGKTSVYFDKYNKVGCFDVVLSVTDERGCPAALYPQVRVRVATNPLKTIYTLDEICNRDSLIVTMGYSGENATLTLQRIESAEVQSKTNNIRVFIPDGMNNCGGCYKAPVVFTEFPNGRTVTSAKDICSICVNYEHTYMGDYDLAILCPTFGAPGMPANHGRALLKSYSSVSGAPAGTSGGGSRQTGQPYGGDRGAALGWDNSSAICDSLENPYGIGWNYCFSLNGDYTLVTGVPANDPNVPNGSGLSNGPQVNAWADFRPVPPGYARAGQTPGRKSTTTTDSSDHVNKLNYYVPADDFSTLVGCPLNGEWNIEVCDHLGADNGWVFSWSLDICNINISECKYEVGIDSLVWALDTSSQYHDYDLGRYRGAVSHPHGGGEAAILTPDTAGTFPVNVFVYDEFGCVWDTTTSITSYWTPNPSLGEDTTLCGAAVQLELDASDRHAATENYSYIWTPTGETTPTVTTTMDPESDVRYVVQVTNTRGTKRCSTRDTIEVRQRRQPYPSFIPDPFTLEGCAPMQLTFQNRSRDGYKHFWDFGDGVTSDQESPTHIYTEGIYTLKYYIVSEDGCSDSLIMDRTIAVYPTPTASFSWSPVYPSVMNPVVQLNNGTVPNTDTTKYFWEIQYNRDNLLSVHTIVEENPVYDFSTFAEDGEVAGDYSVRLIARTDNLAPSGNVVYCRDTTENTVLVVSDFLQFPNVVTPNGDGINDRFEIVNLIGGTGYPINTLDIYNKWGARVYHKENIANEEDFWDPSNMPAGSYFYRFVGRGYNGNIEHNGTVEVVK